jgi:hypothetical protein
MLYQKDWMEITGDGTLRISIGDEQFKDVWVVYKPILSALPQSSDDLMGIEILGLRAFQYVRGGLVEVSLVPAHYAEAPRVPFETLPLGGRIPTPFDANWQRAERLCQEREEELPAGVYRYCQRVLGSEVDFRLRLRRGDIDLNPVPRETGGPQYGPIDFSRDDYYETPQYQAVCAALEALAGHDLLVLYGEFLAVPRDIQTNFGTRQPVIDAHFYHFERSTPVGVIEAWFDQVYSSARGDGPANLRVDYEEYRAAL